MPKFDIYFDGYSSPHKHNRAGWAVLVEKDGNPFFAIHHDLAPLTTNNAAELHGLINALRYAKAMMAGYEASIPKSNTPVGHSRGLAIQILGDNLLAVTLALGTEHTNKPNLRVLARYAKMLFFSFWKFNHLVWIGWTPRDKNRAGIYIEYCRHMGEL